MSEARYEGSLVLSARASELESGVPFGTRLGFVHPVLGAAVAGGFGAAHRADAHGRAAKLLQDRAPRPSRSHPTGGKAATSRAGFRVR